MSDRVAKRLERIDHLRQEIAQLQRENTKDRFYISTLRRLPSELLSEIFIHAAVGGCGTWLAPMVISHVSRRWRVGHKRLASNYLPADFLFGIRTWFVEHLAPGIPFVSGLFQTLPTLNSSRLG